MQIIRTALDVFTAYENLIAEDARQIASGICPIRLKIVAAKVASEKVQQADEEKGRKTTQVRIERGITLLENALIRDCGTIFAALPEGGGNYIAPAGSEELRWQREQTRGTRFLTQAPNESMLLLDRLLLSRLEALHVPPEDVEQMAELFRWQWEDNLIQQQQQQLTLLNDPESEPQRGEERVQASILKLWTVQAPQMPFLEAVGVNGGAVLVRKPDPRMLMFSVHDPEQEPADLMAAISAAIAGGAIPDDKAAYIERLRTWTERFANDCVREAESLPLDAWCRQSVEEMPPTLRGKGYVRPVILAQALWAAEVQQEWDALERRRRPQPSAAGTMRRLQQFSAGGGKKEVVQMTGVQFLSEGGITIPTQEIVRLVEERLLPSQSVLGQHLVRWLSTEARSIAGEGGKISIPGGFTGLAKMVLGTEAPTPKDIRDLREVVQSMDRMMISVRWDSKGWVGTSAVVRIMGDWKDAEDGREKMITLAIGDAFSIHNLPALRDLPAGQRAEIRQVPTIPREMLPPTVLGPRNRAGEVMLADELVRRMAEAGGDYHRFGVKVDNAVLLDILRVGLLPQKDEYVQRLRQAWLAEPGEAGNTTGRPPLFCVVNAGRWQINDAAWPEGNAFLMEGSRRAVEPPRSYNRGTQKRGGRPP